MFTVEDYIEILAGIQSGGSAIKLERADYNLVTSLARQTFKGVAYTDRQFELAKKKVQHYEGQLIAQGFKIEDDDYNNLRLPLREIDRSRWIKIVDDIDNATEHKSSKAPFIAVRFSFQKKLISALEKIRLTSYHYDKKLKIQYFEYSEQNLFKILSAFDGKNFEIDPAVQTIYDKILTFTRENSLPGVYGYKLKNLPDSAINMLEEELGKPNADNLLLYQDRSLKYGLHIDSDYNVDTNSLEWKIAKRKNPNVSLDSANVSLGDLLITLENLQRNRTLILLSSQNDSHYDNIVEAHSIIRNLFKPEEVAVTFRLENKDEGIEFNNYIKKQCINNMVDNNTKIVYNTSNKMPKPLLKSTWTPDTILVLGASGFIGQRKVLDCYPSADLIIHCVEGNSSQGYRSYLGRGIDKL
jgi:hypothetical protein